ncbi:MAG: hypothetical protein V3U72_04560 [Candidatus Aenigmarchaeota archaeon]
MEGIYYFHNPITEKIADYLRSRSNFKSLNFIPVFEDNITITTKDKGYFNNVNGRKAILIWGHGDDHDVSYFFSPGEPYFKSVDDAHDDLRNLEKWGISCCSHNTALLKNDKNLRGLEVLGVTNRYCDHHDPGELKKEFGLNDIEFIRVRHGLKSAIPSGQAVHKSIDLDVVGNYPCSSEYRMGVRTFEEVEQAFGKMLKENDVIRFDVGGLRLAIPKKPSPEEFEGMKAYEKLIGMYLDGNTSMV